MQTPVDYEARLLTADGGGIASVRVVGPWQDRDRTQVARRWAAFRNTLSPASQATDGSSEWNDFSHLAADCADDEQEVSFAILSANECEGFLIGRVGASSRLAENGGRRLLYIEYLAAAPWNQRVSAESRRLRGIGEMLLLIATQASRHANLAGVVGLHSKPNAEPFYERWGFTALGPEFCDSAGFRYLEWTESQAATFLARVGSATQ